eukprot:g16042.t1
MYTATNAPASMGHQNPCSRRIDPTTGWPVADRNEGLYAAMTTSYDPTAASPGSCKKPSITAKARLFCFANYACGFAVAVFVVFVLTCGISQSKLFKNRVAPLLGKAAEKGGGAATSATAAGAASRSPESSAQLLAAKQETPAGPAAAVASTSRDFLAPRTTPADLAEGDEGPASAQDAEPEEEEQQGETETETSSEATDSTSSPTAAEEAEPTSSSEVASGFEPQREEESQPPSSGEFATRSSLEEYQAAGDERVANAAGDGSAEDDEEAESFLGEKTAAAALPAAGRVFGKQLLGPAIGALKGLGPAIARTMKAAGPELLGAAAVSAAEAALAEKAAARPETNAGHPAGTAGAPAHHPHSKSNAGPAVQSTGKPSAPATPGGGASALEMYVTKPVEVNVLHEQACAQEAGAGESERALDSDFSVVSSRSMHSGVPLSSVPPMANSNEGREHAFIENAQSTRPGAPQVHAAARPGQPGQHSNAPSRADEPNSNEPKNGSPMDKIWEGVGHVWNGVERIGGAALQGLGERLEKKAQQHVADATDRVGDHFEKKIDDVADKALNGVGLGSGPKPTAQRK